MAPNHQAVRAVSLCVTEVATREEEGAAAPDDFDFWVGHWDASFEEGKRGTNQLTWTLGGKVLEEDFHSADLNGRSWSMYLPTRKIWVQTWVDDKGSYLLFVGGRQSDGTRVFSQRLPLGGEGDHRMVFSKISADSFDWDWQRTPDGGATWELLWHIDYRRRTS